MPSALIIGAARGLGLALTTTFQSQSYTVFATTRSNMPPQEVDTGLVRWLTQIDLSSPSCGTDLASALKAQHLKEPVDVVVITAGYFGLESFEDMDWEGQVKMYTLSAIAPGFLVRGLVEGGLLREGKEGKEGEGAKVILVGSESGSVGLRHEKEGGGNYGHHGSKAAVNMVGKLLGLDLMGRGIVVGVVHPGFMRTEMTKGVGFDKFWDEGGAVTPEVAAESLVKFIVNDFGIDKTGEYWAPRGPGDIGTSDETMGKNLPTPLKLPY